MNYLYNGTELPALPEWDKEKYPYAVIGSTANGGWADGGTNWLYACSAMPHLNDKGEVVCGTKEAQCLYWACHYGDEWDYRGSSSITTMTAYAPVWTNTDILYEDGTVYLAASDPIPVLSFDRTALVMGWHIGRMLKAMRGKKPTEPDTPVEPEYDVVFENGVLYIKKAPAIMVGSTLSFASTDINGGELNG